MWIILRYISLYDNSATSCITEDCYSPLQCHIYFSGLLIFSLPSRLKVSFFNLQLWLYLNLVTPPCLIFPLASSPLVINTNRWHSIQSITILYSGWRVYSVPLETLPLKNQFCHAWLELNEVIAFVPTIYYIEGRLALYYRSVPSALSLWYRIAFGWFCNTNSNLTPAEKE